MHRLQEIALGLNYFSPLQIIHFDLLKAMHMKVTDGGVLACMRMCVITMHPVPHFADGNNEKQLYTSGLLPFKKKCKSIDSEYS